MRRESQTRGGLTVTLERPASTLEAHQAKIKKVLKRELPDEVRRFYADSDGLSHQAARGGVILGERQELSGLERLFDGFKPHRQIKNEEAFYEAIDEGALYENPFCGEIFSEDFELNERGDLARLNTMLRSKLLVSVAGAPDALIIDFAPKAKKGEVVDYQIALAHEGNDLCPMAISFSEFVEQFSRFGAAGWYYAYIGKRGAAQLNIDAREAVSTALAGYVDGFGDEVKALVARAGR